MTFPQDYGKKEVAGQEAEFMVALHEIKEKKLPVVDNDFAKDVGKCETVKEFERSWKLRSKLPRKSNRDRRWLSRLVRNCWPIHPFDVPVSLVNMEQQRLVQQGVDRLKRQGIDANKLADDQKKEFVEKLSPVAQKNVQMALIVEKIAETEKITCEEKDLEAYYEKSLRVPISRWML